MVGVSVSAVGVVVEADCRGQGVQKNSRWGAVIPLCPFLPSSSSHLLTADPWGLTIRLHLSLPPHTLPTSKPIIHSHPNYSPTTLLPYTLSPPIIYVSVSSLLIKPKAQVATSCPLKCLMNCTTVATVRKHSSDCRVNDEWLSKAEMTDFSSHSS